MVHDSDLIETLKSLGVFDKIQNGLANCECCGGTVTLDTLYAVFSKNGGIRFVCSKNNCITKL